MFTLFCACDMCFELMRNLCFSVIATKNSVVQRVLIQIL